MRFLWLLTLFLAPGAMAAPLIETKINQGGLPFTYTIDENLITRIDGIPLPGLTLLYDLNTSTLYAHLAGQPKTYAVTMGVYARNLPEAKLKAGNAWQDYLGTPSKFWQLEVDNTTCAHIFANDKAARQSQLNMTHLTRIQAGLAHLFGPPPATTCGTYLVPRAHGVVMGLPMHLIRQGGEVSEVTAISQIEGPLNKLPVLSVEPLTAEAHTRFLKSMLPAGTQAAFESSSSHLPWRQQVKALKNLLNQLALTD